ncbi:MAG: hypothetical protein IH596_15170 [Bacteroidales bacterium]|nr:hypothetical protein [Bacteroidales bacterium]
MKSVPLKIVSLAGYAVAILAIGITIALYSRTLNFKARLDETRQDYESLLSEKLQLERSYYRLKEERILESAPGAESTSASQFSDSLKALKIQQEEEVAKLYKKIEELHQQIIQYQKMK